MSTPLGRENFFSQLMAMLDDDGNPFFKTITITNVCDACEQTGDAKIIEACRHNQTTWTAPNKDPNKTRRNKRIYREFGQEAQMLREMLGIVADEGCAAFAPEVIRALEEAPEYDIPLDASTVFICVDPSGGGGSDMAIISGCYVNDILVIVGADAVHTPELDNQKTALIAHINMLRGSSFFRTCPIILIIENNARNAANYLAGWVRHMPGLHVYQQTGKAVPGILKTHPLTMAYREEANNRLTRRGVGFWRYLWTLSGRLGDRAGARRELVTQARRMSTQRKIRPDGSIEISFSGKGSGMRTNDDLFIAFAMLILCPFMVMRDGGFCDSVTTNL